MSGPFGSSQWMYNSGADFYNGLVTQSLRFDDGSNTYLYDETDTTPTSTTHSTYSFWVKRATLGSHIIYSAYTSAPNVAGYIQFNTNHILVIYLDQTAGGSDEQYWNSGSQVFRDTSAWYHVVIQFNLDEVAIGNRVVAYVNGENINLTVGSTTGSGVTAHRLLDNGIRQRWGNYFNDSLDFDGYLAEVNVIDGQVVSPDSFGETKNGIWIPKAYDGTYGNNGYRFTFEDSSNVGDDTSGNGHDFTSYNFSAFDVMPDSPENNFCTYNPLDPKGNDNTFSEGNLKVVVNAQNTDEQTTATFAVSSGKWYWEHRLNSTTTTAGYFKIGLRGTDADGSAWTVRGSDGEIQDSSGTTGSSSVSYTTNNVIGIYLDMDNGKWYVSVDGVLQNSANLTNGTGFLHSNLTGEVRPFILNASSGGTHTGQGNFGQDSTFSGLESAGGYSDANGNGDFHSSVFSGYLALCSANISDDDLPISPAQSTQAVNHFGILTYTGNGTDSGSTNDIRSGDVSNGVGGEIDFKPDWTWIKSKSNTSNHILTDSVRLAGNVLFSNLPNGEADNTAFFTSFETNGFDLAQNGGDTNASGYTYVAWNWKAGGTAVLNEQGSIDSNVSANTDAGFSVVTWTGDGNANASVGHGLDAIPKIIIIKNRDASQDWVANVNLPTKYRMVLNQPYGDSGDFNTYMGTQTDDNIVFGGTNHPAWNGSGNEMVAYCFHSVDGYSKIGSYTGNGSTDGTFVYTGFRPAWLMVKRTDTTCSWVIVDSVRDPINVAGKRIFADSNLGEFTNVDNPDLVSNGFKVRIGSTDNCANALNGTYIYMAFAEAPFKYANAR